MRDCGVEHCLEVGEIQLAVLRRDEHHFIDEQIGARAVCEELLFIERIHLLLCGGDENVGGAAVLNRLLEGATAAEIEDELRIPVLLLVHAAEFLHRVGKTRRRRDLQLSGTFLRRVHLIC